MTSTLTKVPLWVLRFRVQGLGSGFGEESWLTKAEYVVEGSWDLASTATSTIIRAISYMSVGTRIMALATKFHDLGFWSNISVAASRVWGCQGWDNHRIPIQWELRYELRNLPWFNVAWSLWEVEFKARRRNEQVAHGDLVTLVHYRSARQQVEEVVHLHSENGRRVRA